MSDFESCIEGLGGPSANENRMNPKCKFEPYRTEFFDMDALTGTYPMRQQVLFNLYAFASD